MADMQPAAPGFPLPIRRELLNIQAWLTDSAVMVQLTCDCAAITTAQIAAPLPEHDFALSCAGCNTSHWINFRFGQP